MSMNPWSQSGVLQRSPPNVARPSTMPATWLMRCVLLSGSPLVYQAINSPKRGLVAASIELQRD